LDHQTYPGDVFYDHLVMMFGGGSARGQDAAFVEPLRLWLKE
jgi:hypothetical protein